MSLQKNSNTAQQHMNLSNWLMLLLLSVLWGGSFFFIGVAVKAFPPLTIVSLRLGIAALMLWLILVLKGFNVADMFKHWKVFLILGLFNNVLPFCLIVWAQGHITSGLASILNATTPIFTVIVAGLFLSDEPMTMNKILGVICGFIGVFILLGISSDSLQLGNLKIMAESAVLIAAFCYSIASVFGRKIAKMDIAPLQAATGQISLSFLLLLPITFYFEAPLSLPMPSYSVWLALGGLAVLSTVLAYYIYFKLLETSGALNLMLVTFLIPISAIILGVSFLSEVLQFNQIIGMLIIGMGLIFIDGRWLKLKKRLEVSKSL